MRRRSGNFWVHLASRVSALAVAAIFFIAVPLPIARAEDEEPEPQPKPDCVQDLTDLAKALKELRGNLATPVPFNPFQARIRLIRDPIPRPEHSNAETTVPFPFTVSKETTVLTAPLRPDGGVDFLTALNEQAGRGVTPENNAAVLLLRVLGPAGTDIDKRGKLFKLLGMERLPEQGDYLQRDDQFLEQRSQRNSPNVDRQSELQERFSRELEQAKRTVWSAIDCPLVAGWLAANEHALELAVEASRRTRFFVPLIADHPGVPLRSTCDTFGFAQCGDLRVLLSVRALSQIQDSDIDGGRETFLAAHRLVRLLGQDFNLGNYAAAVNWETELCAAERAAADSGKLSVAQIRAWQKSLDELPPLPRPVERMNTFARYCLLDELAYALGEKADDDARSDQDDVEWVLSKLGNSLTDGDEAARWINRWVDRWVALAEAQYDPAPDADVTKNVGRTSQSDQDGLGKPSSDSSCTHPSGQVLAMMSAESDYLRSELDSDRATLQYLIGTRAWRGRLRGADLARGFTVTANFAAEQGASAATTMRLTRVALSLAAYNQEQGKFPAELSALVPKHLSALPRDAFTSAEFRYRRTADGYLLYSVGLNGRDDDGRDQYDEAEQVERDDLVVRFPPPPPPDTGTQLPWVIGLFGK